MWRVQGGGRRKGGRDRLVLTRVAGWSLVRYGFRLTLIHWQPEPVGKDRYVRSVSNPSSNQLSRRSESARQGRRRYRRAAQPQRAAEIRPGPDRNGAGTFARLPVPARRARVPFSAIPDDAGIAPPIFGRRAAPRAVRRAACRRRVVAGEPDHRQPAQSEYPRV